MEKFTKNIEKLLNLIPLSIEEERILLLLLFHHQEEFSPKQLKELYESEFKVKIGNKIYFVLNKLRQKNLVFMDLKRKKFSCNIDDLKLQIWYHIHREYKTKISIYNELSENIIKSPLSMYSDSDVVYGFSELELKILKEGGTFLDIRDILPYTADKPETLELRRKEYGEMELPSYTKLDSYRIVRRQELFKDGRLFQIMVLDKISTEQALKYWLGRYGYSYVIGRLYNFLELLKLPNYQVVFSKHKINFMLEIIPGRGVALYWRSRPFAITDRLIVFWDRSVVASFENYFWKEYNTSLEGKDEKKAKEEVICWTEKLINLLENKKEVIAK